MPVTRRYGSPVSMGPTAVNEFNSLVQTTAGQSDFSLRIFEMFKAKFTGA